ncbi:hypothetical protein VTN00DRAFT_3098 [Thermoascus crustaceus]|uniref:uncharacterized protein n=1 Tax=Thermoascus crustaceus TaxID=5088 RepID=UPI0037444F0B
MPMKWTPENDHVLLLKILETHDISVDVKKVAAAWPDTDDGAKPTPRAITERLVRLRQMVKSSGANFSIGEGKGTPRKPRSNTSSAAATPASRKRKNAATPSDPAIMPEPTNSDGGDTEVDESAVDTPSKKPQLKQEQPVRTGVKRRRVKQESSDSEITLADIDSVDDTPTKRLRTPARLPTNMVVYEGNSEAESNAYESSVSEFIPEGSVGQENEYKDMDDEIDMA